MTSARSLLCACLAFGCSEVLVEPEGDGGRSAGDESASASTGVDHALCDAFCGAVGSCFASCIGVCRGYFSRPCSAEGGALVDCFVDHYDPASCGASECDAEMQALLACRSTATPVCEAHNCGGGDTECTCTAHCEGGQQQALCTSEGGEAVCTCYLNFMPVYTCSSAWGPGTTEACNMQSGCCTEVFGACTDCPY